ncbi:MAG: hypothetical protein LUI61_01935 [Firmicutes bacterium]|nr:hypothetical protein [Bacillota bacterium]
MSVSTHPSQQLLVDIVTGTGLLAAGYIAVTDIVFIFRLLLDLPFPIIPDIPH